MLYKNKKVKVRSLDGDADFFNIITGELQGGHISPIHFYYLSRLRSSKVNRFNERITDADYADDTVLLANSPAEAKSLLHILERTVSGISLHVSLCALIKQVTSPH